jgi:hypothetical protein
MKMHLKEAFQGDLFAWQGLSNAETRASISEALNPWLRVHDPVERTRISQRFNVIEFERLSAPELVEVWFLYGSHHVALIEYENPPVQNLDQLLEHYGPPELILDNKRFAVGATVKEFIYASRGITLSIAEGLDETGRDFRKVIHIQLFPATSPQFYITDIGTGQELRPYPWSNNSTQP